VQGARYGTKLGFPTANLARRQYSKLKNKPKLGVWAGTAILPSGKNYKAGIVIGPIDKKGLPKIEVYLIGFKGNLYGKYVSICLNTYIRSFKKFKDVKKLKQQIKKDIKIIKEIVNSNK